MTTSLAIPDSLELLREVADGPTAVLFAAERSRQGIPSLASVKVLRRRRPETGALLGRATAAGRQLARLGHRHIVAPTDLVLVDDRPGLVGPWIEGVDLLDLVEILRETGTELPSRVICDIVRSTASALDAAYNRAPWGSTDPLRLPHRDVKPSNLMVDRDGELKLLDFGSGISSLSGDAAAHEVQSAGWTRYWCPHRRQGSPAGPECDVYALGVLAIELFRGRWLRRTRNTNPAHDRHLAEVVASLPDTGLRGTEDDRALRSLLLRMVAYDPDARPPAVEVVHTLRSLADRATGPTLESFAHDHALPYIEPPLAVPGMPGAHLVDGAVLEERLALTGPDDEPDEPHRWASGDDPSDEDSSGTEEVAELTARALREHRRQRAAKRVERVEPGPIGDEATAWIPETQVPAGVVGDAPSALPGEPPPEGVITPAAAEPTAEASPPAPPSVPSAPPIVSRSDGGRIAALLGALGLTGATLMVVAALLGIVGLAVVTLWLL